MAQAYTFNVPPGRTAAEVIHNVRRQAAARGITFDGDATAGTFSGMAAGSYTVAGSAVTVSVDKKPGFVPWGVVESALRGLFEAP